MIANLQKSKGKKKEGSLLGFADFQPEDFVRELHVSHWLFEPPVPKHHLLAAEAF